MMLYFIVSQNNDEIFKNYLIPGLQQWEIKSCICTDSTPGVIESIFQKYNAGIDKLVNNTECDPLKDDDVVAFCHEDVKLLDPNFVQKVELVFSQRGDIGLCGVVGSTEIGDTGGWWHASPDKLRGHIIQENGTTANHLLKGPVGFFDDLVVVDGLCFFIRGSLLINGLRFDQTTYTGFDFYDLDICLSVLEKGFKIGCADILLQHRSIGDVSKKNNWYASRDRFIKKWKDKNLSFPLTQKTFIDDNIKEVEV
jgi:hypothetical protein